MGKKIGIDLGTTNTVVAIMDGPRPRVLDSRENRSQMRSVVGLKRRRGKRAEGDKGEILVGDVAVDNWGMAPRDTILSVKRLMGRGMNDPEVQSVANWAQFRLVEPSNGTKDSVSVIMGDEEYSPVDISAMILKKAKEDAEFRLGEEVTHAVITVPAYFSQIQRHATQQAGIKAGLTVIKVLDEPTAAAIAFGTDTKDDNPRTLLVYDLGGGTFDVSLLMVAGSVFAPLNLEGDMWLGGDNLDQIIVDWALKWVRDEYDVDGSVNNRFMSELRKAAKAVKERLSSSQSADLILPSLLQDEDGNILDVDMELSGDEFLRSVLPLVGRYRECTCGVANLADATSCAVCDAPVGDRPVQDGRTVAIVKKALGNANQTADEVDLVFMAGNSSAVPMTHQTMEELFGADKIIRDLHPKHSVALGAAIVAAWGSEGMECQAPHPEDAGKVCGKDNEVGAVVCERCGAPLGVVQDGGAGDPDMARSEDFGGIAPFSYGTQTAGDTYNVFIHKSDSYPTDDPVTQTFSTGVPGQRMVSIPIYGGEELEKASANELQGQAFALLPPELPAETPVRIRLWLDGDGVFGLGAQLANGTNLDPWVLEGGVDAAVIERLEKVEELIAKQADAFTSQAQSGMDRTREELFDLMKGKDFDGAAKKLDVLEKKARKGADEAEGGNLAEKAQSLMRFAEFVLGEFKWAFGDPAAVYRITSAVEETREALDAGKPADLEAAVQKLDEVTDHLPPPVMIILSFKGAIHNRVHPVDPGKAAALSRDVDLVQEKMEEIDDMMATPALGKAIMEMDAKITEAIKEADRKRPGAARCATCGSELSAGQRHCEKCGADSWQLVGGAPGM